MTASINYNHKENKDAFYLTALHSSIKIALAINHSLSNTLQDDTLKKSLE